MMIINVMLLNINHKKKRKIQYNESIKKLVNI